MVASKMEHLFDKTIDFPLPIVLLRQHQWKIERHRAAADVPIRTANNRRHLLLHLVDTIAFRKDRTEHGHLNREHHQLG